MSYNTGFMPTFYSLPCLVTAITYVRDECKQAIINLNDCLCQFVSHFLSLDTAAYNVLTQWNIYWK